jgi:GrpB-like predicted nucleotidyltransferase (UPF0157 family)
VTISVLPYDPDWVRRFEAERDLLMEILAPWLARDDGRSASSGAGAVHHVGSTAVPGLAAKPVIDMIAGVADLDSAGAAIEVLSGHSYVHAPHRPRALWFHKPVAPEIEVRTHNLHLTEPGSDLWRERLAFRDALRADDALRAEYQALKLRLVQAHPDDLGAYTAAKRELVGRVLAGAGISLGPPRSSVN